MIGLYVPPHKKVLTRIASSKASRSPSSTRVANLIGLNVTVACPKAMTFSRSQFSPDRRPCSIAAAASRSRATTSSNEATAKRDWCLTGSARPPHLLFRPNSVSLQLTPATTMVWVSGHSREFLLSPFSREHPISWLAARKRIDCFPPQAAAPRETYSADERRGRMELRCRDVAAAAFRNLCAKALAHDPIESHRLPDFRNEPARLASPQPRVGAA